MSFLIENILREDFGSECAKECCQSNGNKNNKMQRSISMNDSILHQTLMRKSYSNRRFSQYDGEMYPPRLGYFDRKLSYSSGYPNTGIYQPSWYDEMYWSFTKNTVMSVSLNQLKQYKRKGGQIRFTTYQTDLLEKTFVSHKYLTPEERKLIADNLTLSDRQVKTWFQNRRAKWRRSVSSTTDTSTDDPKEVESSNEICLD